MIYLGLNTKGKREVCDCENLRQWSRLRIILNTFVGKSFCRNNSSSSSSSFSGPSKFCSKAANSFINKIHKRSLPVKYEMEDTNFEEFLIKNITLGLFMKTIFPYCESVSL